LANNKLLASDSFASGSLAAGWSGFWGNLPVQVITGPPNYTEPNNTSNAAGQIWTGLTWPEDQISEVTMKHLGTAVLSIQVRAQSGAAVSGYQVNIANNAATLYSYTNGAGTQLATQSGLTFADGDVWTLMAVGSTILLYQNGVRVLYAFDVTWTSGYPGYSEYATAGITNIQVYSWRGYSAVQQDGVWQKQGVVIPAIASDFANSGIGVLTNSAVLYEGNAQILSGTVFKTLFSGGNENSGHTGSIYYAESSDGKSWSRKATAVVADYIIPTLLKVGSTYYCYCQPDTGDGSADFALYTSSDMVTWAQQSTTILGLGSAGAWDSSNVWIFQPVAVIAGTWYALYGGAKTGAYAMGLATAPAAAGPWTKYAGNPVLTNAFNTQAIVQVNGTWYLWAENFEVGRGTYNPVDTVRYQSTDLIHWTNPVHSVHCSQLHENLNGVFGQSFANAILDVSGKAYMFVTSALQNGPNPQNNQITLAIAPAPVASIITTNEDAVQPIAQDSFSNLNNWTLPTGGTALQVTSGKCEPTVATGTHCVELYTRASFGGSQYCEATIAALTGTNASLGLVLLGQTGSLNYYYVGIGGGGSCQIFKRVAGTFTAISQALLNITPLVGDVFRFAVVVGSDGSNILSIYQNGFLILEIQDYAATFTSGYPGLDLANSSAVTGTQVSLWAGGNANVIPNYPPMPNPNNIALFNSTMGFMIGALASGGKR
jgi:hypothetical protein